MTQEELHEDMERIEDLLRRAKELESEDLLRQAHVLARETADRHRVNVENVPRTMDALLRREPRPPGFWTHGATGSG